MRIATIAVLVIVLSAGAALARLGPPTPRLPDFAYSVALRNYDRDAVCVARGGNTATPKRLAGLGEFQGFDWSLTETGSPPRSTGRPVRSVSGAPMGPALSAG